MQIIEEVGEDYLIPAHVVPPKKEAGTIRMLLQARRDLLSFWTEECYSKNVIGFRILGRQILIANSPETVKHVMVTNNQNYERKSPQMRRALENLLGDGLFISDGDTWKFRRRVVSPIIHRNHMPSFAPIMVEASLDMVRQWRGLGPGGRIDGLVEMASLTAEIICRAVFGNQLGRANATEVIEGFSDYQRLIDQVNLGYFLGFDEGLPQFRGPRLRRAIRRVHGVIDGIIGEHLEGRGEKDSMVAMLLQARDEETGRGMTPVEIRNEAATIFMAGHETTAATLTWAWYMLALAPWAERKLHQELQEVLGDRPATLEDVPKLRYARAIIEETLRLYPPVPLLTRQAREPDMLANRKVEPAALVMVVPWLLHRRRDLWERPNHFVPERFTEGTPPNRNAYVPFATGPRICPGASFGLTEAILCLATLAQHFKLRLVPGTRVEPRCRLTLRPVGGLPLILEPRE